MTREQNTPDGLTERQRAFVRAYAGPGTGTAAARAAGYSGGDAALTVAASRLLRHRGVREALVARGVVVPPIDGSARKPRSHLRVVPSTSTTSSSADVRLTPKQLTAIAALLEGKTHAEAAEAARVTDRTIRRWLESTAFRAELDDRRLEVLERARRRLEGMALAALETVEQARLGKVGRIELAAAKSVLDLLGLGRAGHDPEALRARLYGEAAAWLAESLQGRLPADTYRQVADALRGLRAH